MAAVGHVVTATGQNLMTANIGSRRWLRRARRARGQGRQSMRWISLPRLSCVVTLRPCQLGQRQSSTFARTDWACCAPKPLVARFKIGVAQGNNLDPVGVGGKQLLGCAGHVTKAIYTTWSSSPVARGRSSMNGQIWSLQRQTCGYAQRGTAYSLVSGSQFCWVAPGRARPCDSVLRSRVRRSVVAGALGYRLSAVATPDEQKSPRDGAAANVLDGVGTLSQEGR